jgi:molybdenum cofactor synthesis domain-containing protein
MMRVAILTVSDGVAAGEREDGGGPALAAACAEAMPEAAIEERAVVPDDRAAIADRLRRWRRAGIHLVLATGGTGVSPRDRTPEAFRDVVDFEIPGFAEKMRADTGATFPAAYLSRSVAGVAGGTVCLALPGSPRGAVDCFRAVAALLPHAIALARGERPPHPPGPAR